MQACPGYWDEPQLQRGPCGPQQSKVASNPPSLDLVGNKAPCGICAPWEQTFAPHPSSRTHPNFHSSLNVDACQNSCGGSQSCLPEPSWSFWQIQTHLSAVTLPRQQLCLVLSTVWPRPRGQVRLGCAGGCWVWSPFPPLSGVSLHISAAWGRTSWKSRELASPCCCGLHFVWGSLGLLRKERRCRLGESGFLLSEHSGEGLSQLVVLHWKVTKKRKKYPCVCCLQTASCQISLAK